MTDENAPETTWIAKGMVLTVGLFVVAVPILLGVIMFRSFFASDNNAFPKPQETQTQAEKAEPVTSPGKT